LAYGYIEIKAQMSVDRTSKISAIAKKLFCKPNWIGVNAKLNIRFKIKGSMIIKGIFLVKNK
jgi:hypothetical protein